MQVVFGTCLAISCVEKQSNLELAHFHEVDYEINTHPLVSIRPRVDICDEAQISSMFGLQNGGSLFVFEDLHIRCCTRIGVDSYMCECVCVCVCAFPRVLSWLQVHMLLRHACVAIHDCVPNSRCSLGVTAFLDVNLNIDYWSRSTVMAYEFTSLADQADDTISDSAYLRQTCDQLCMMQGRLISDNHFFVLTGVALCVPCILTLAACQRRPHDR